MRICLVRPSDALNICGHKVHLYADDGDTTLWEGSPIWNGESAEWPVFKCELAVGRLVQGRVECVLLSSSISCCIECMFGVLSRYVSLLLMVSTYVYSYVGFT